MSSCTTSATGRGTNTTKSMIGHTLGACGALEFVASALMLENQFLHPTINLRKPDPQCDLDYVPHKARDLKVTYAMTNSFGFGGQNDSIIVKRFVDGPALPPR